MNARACTPYACDNKHWQNHIKGCLVGRQGPGAVDLKAILAMIQQGIQQEQGYNTRPTEQECLSPSSGPPLVASLFPAAAGTYAEGFLRAAADASLHKPEGLTPPSWPQELTGLPTPKNMTGVQPVHQRTGIIFNLPGQSQLSAGVGGAAAAAQTAGNPAGNIAMLTAAMPGTAAIAAVPMKAVSAQQIKTTITAYAGQKAAALDGGPDHLADTALAAADATTVATDGASTVCVSMQGARQQVVSISSAPGLNVSIPSSSAVYSIESTCTNLAITPGSMTWPASYPVAAALTQQGALGPGAAAVAAAAAAGWKWQHPDAAAAYAAAVDEAVMSSHAGPGIHSTKFTAAAQQFIEGISTLDVTAAAAAVKASTAIAGGWAADTTTLQVAIGPGLPSCRDIDNVGFNMPTTAQAAVKSNLAQQEFAAATAADYHLLQSDATQVHDVGMPSASNTGPVQWQQKQHSTASSQGGSRRNLANLFQRWVVQPDDSMQANRESVTTTVAAAGDTVQPIAATGGCRGGNDSGNLMAATVAVAAYSGVQAAMMPGPTACAVVHARDDAVDVLETTCWQQQQAQQQQALQDFEAAAPSTTGQAAAKAEQYGLSELMWVMEAEAAAERAAVIAAAYDSQMTSVQGTSTTKGEQKFQQQQQTPIAPTPSRSQRHAGAGIRRLMSPGLYSFTAASPANSPTPSMAAIASALVASPSPVQSRASVDAAHAGLQRAGPDPTALGPARAGSQQQQQQQQVGSSISVVAMPQRPSGGFLSDQFAVPESAVAGLMQLQGAGDHQSLPRDLSATGCSLKPSNGKMGGRTSRTPKQSHMLSEMVPAAADGGGAAAAGAAVSASMGPQLSGLDFADAGFGGSPLQPLFRGSSRSSLMSPSVLYQFDSTANFLSPSGGALGFLHTSTSASPGQLDSRNFNDSSSHSPRPALARAATCGGDAAGSASVFTPSGRVSGRSAVSKGDEFTLNSPESLFKTPKVPPLGSYAAGHDSNLRAHRSELRGQSGFGASSRDHHSITGATNLASPTSWSMAPAVVGAAQGPLLQLHGPGAPPEATAEAAEGAEQGLGAALGAVLACSTARVGGYGFPVSSPESQGRAAFVRDVESEMHQQHTPIFQDTGEGHLGACIEQQLRSPGLLIPNNHLSSLYHGFMSPTIYTWRQPLHSPGEGGTPAAGPTEPTADMFSKRLAAPLESPGWLSGPAAQRAAEHTSRAAPQDVRATASCTAGARWTTEVTASDALAATSSKMGSATGGGELVNGADLLLGLAAAAVDADSAGIGGAAGAPTTWAGGTAADAAGVHDAAATLVMLSPHKRTRERNKPPQPVVAVTDLHTADVPALVPVTAPPAGPVVGVPDSKDPTAAATCGATKPHANIHGPSAATATGNSAQPLSPQSAGVHMSPEPSSSLAAHDDSSSVGPAQNHCQTSSKKHAAGSRSGRTAIHRCRKGGSLAAAAAHSTMWPTPVQQQALQQTTQECMKEECSMLAQEGDTAAEVQQMQYAQEAELQEEGTVSDGLADRVKAMLAPPPSPTRLTRPSGIHTAAAGTLEAVAACADKPQMPALVNDTAATPASAAGAAGVTFGMCVLESTTALGNRDPAGSTPVTGDCLKSSDALPAGTLLLERGLQALPWDSPGTAQQHSQAAEGAGDTGAGITGQSLGRSRHSPQDRGEAVEEADAAYKQCHLTADLQLGVGFGKERGAAGPAEVLAALQVLEQPFTLPAHVTGTCNKLTACTEAEQRQQEAEEKPERPSAELLTLANAGAAAVAESALVSELCTPQIQPKTRSRRATADGAGALAVQMAGRRSSEAPALDLLSAAVEVAAGTARQAVTSAFRTLPADLSGTPVPAAVAAALVSPPAAAMAPVFTPAAQAPGPAFRSRSTGRKPLSRSKYPAEAARHSAEVASDPPHMSGRDASMSRFAGYTATEKRPGGDVAAAAVAGDLAPAGRGAALMAPEAQQTPTAAAAMAPAITPPCPSPPGNGLILQSYYIDPSSPDHLRLRPKRAAARNADTRRKQQQEQQAVTMQALSNGARGGVRLKQEPEQNKQHSSHGGQQGSNSRRKRRSSALAAVGAGAEDDAAPVGTPGKRAGRSTLQEACFTGRTQQQRHRLWSRQEEESAGSRDVSKGCHSKHNTGLALLAAAGEAAVAAGAAITLLDQQLQRPAGVSADKAANGVNSKAEHGSGSDKEEQEAGRDEREGSSASEESDEYSGASGTSSDSWQGGSNNSGDDESDNDSSYRRSKQAGRRRARSVAAAGASSKRARQPPMTGASSSAKKSSSPAAAGESQRGSRASGGSSAGAAPAPDADAAAASRTSHSKGGRPLGAGNKGQMVPRFTDQSGQLKFGCRSTVFTGVYRCKRHTVRWRTQFSYGGKVLNVGSFPTELDAARAWNAAAIHFRGRDTWLNPVEPQLPEDGGAAVAEKLPQPPWGSLLLTTMNESTEQQQQEEEEEEEGA